MKRFFQILLPLLLAAMVSACSKPSSLQSPFTYPSGMALGYLPISNIRTLFIANTFTGTISEINTATDSAMNVTTPTGTVNAIPLNMYPYSLDYNNGYLYVTGFTQSTGLLESLNLLTNQTTSTVNLKGYPFKARLITQTSMLYVIDSDNNNFYLESFTVSSVITPSTFTTLTFTPTAMALSSDDKSIFVSYQGQSFVSIFDPASLDIIRTINTDYPVTAMHALNQYANTMLYAVVFTGTGYNLESINISSGTIGYEFTLPGVPYGMAISPQRVLLDDNHFSYLGIVANANGYIDFLNIDQGCNVPAIPSTSTGLILTSSVRAANLPSLQAITTNDCTTQSETWTVVYNASGQNYTVSGSVSGLQPTPATNGSFFDASNDAVSFYINPGSVQLNNNDMFSFNTVAAQQIRAILGLGFPQQVIIDPVTNQAFISDALTYIIYAVSPSTQSLITTIR